MSGHERFTAMFREHYPLVLAFVARRTDPARAHDVVADTFTAAWRHFDRLPPQPLPWLYRVARNCLANEMRSARRQTRIAEKIAGHGLDPEPDHALSVVADTGLRQALGRLSPGDREALLLIGWEGLDNDAAATVLGCSTVAFKVRIHRARRRLSRLLAADDASATDLPDPAAVTGPGRSSSAPASPTSDISGMSPGGQAADCGPAHPASRKARSA